ncbi:MAG: NTP transferase domain-containing protein [Gemmatimonadetes bacterium]|nr:NTP transferase domain-containing protein [Gemmatimonadota bacterium]
MKGVIMAGGFGTRLKPLTISRPKPMVPVANRPMMEHIVELLKRHGITDLISILYFQPEQITSHFGDGASFGVSMQYVTAESDFGTAGAVRNAADLIGDTRCLVISGDVLTDFDLSAAVAEHETRGAEATIALTAVENPLAYGIVIVNPETGLIERFLEKPTWGQVFSDTINTGIYILEPAALARVPPGANTDFSRDLFPAMLSDRARLYGHIAHGYWRDVGNIDEYRRANEDALAGRVKLVPRGRARTGGGATVHGEHGAAVGLEVKVTGCVILGRSSSVGARASLENVIVGPGCEIGEGAELRDVVLWEDCVIGKGARLYETVCASDVRVGEGALIREKCILSEGAEVGAFAVVGPNVKVWPGKVVEDRAVLAHSLVWGEAWERSLFNNARVSGIPNFELTPEIAARLGGAYGSMLGPGAYLATSRDADRASRMVNRALVAGFVSAGVHVEDLQEMPIPVLRHVVHHGRETGGIHVRRSPFDSRVIDILFIDTDGRDLPPGKTQSIERLFAREDFSRAGPEGTGELYFPTRIVEGYSEHFLTEIARELIEVRQFSIVVDFAYGSTVGVFPRLLGALGIEMVSLDAYAAPGRLTRSDEEFQESQRRLGGIVQSVNAHLGLWLDPGGEVIYLVDDRGRPLSGEQTQAIFVRLALQHLGTGRVAVPVTSPGAVVSAIRESGAEMQWTKTEHHAMMGSATEADLVAGTRGEFIFPQFLPAYDGMFASVRFLEGLARAGVAFHELVDALPPIHVLQRRVACSWGRRGAVMRRLMEATEGQRRDLVDGVKVWKNETEWALIIPHSHRPYFVVTVEGSTLDAARTHLDEWSAHVEKWRDEN